MKLTDETKSECIEALARAGWEKIVTGTDIPGWDLTHPSFKHILRRHAARHLRPIFEIIERQEP